GSVEIKPNPEPNQVQEARPTLTKPIAKPAKKISGDLSMLSKRKGKVSFKNQLKKAKETQEEETLLEGGRRTTILISSLTEAWNRFAESQIEVGGKMASQLLLSKPPELISETLIKINFHSKSEETVFQAIRIRLINYLRQTLENDALNIETELIQTKREGNYQTEEELVKTWRAEHPYFEKLRRHLDLDIL
ncbi:MAG: hypothetical protein ACPGEC_04110, partial [Flavobacteriales bacterium]